MGTITVEQVLAEAQTLCRDEQQQLCAREGLSLDGCPDRFATVALWCGGLCARTPETQ
jgi:hypothetical protein